MVSGNSTKSFSEFFALTIGMVEYWNYGIIGQEELNKLLIYSLSFFPIVPIFQDRERKLKLSKYL